MRIFLINGLYLFGDNRAGVFRALASVDALFNFERKTKMKNKGLLYAIIASLVLSSMLTACADTEDSDTAASNTQAPAFQTTVETDKATENATDAVTDAQATNAPATNAPVEDTKAPETQAPETDPPATKAPETQAPVDDKVYASKEEYPDDWGISDGIIRAKGDIFFWEDSRVMHTAPKGIPGPEDWFVDLYDKEKDQFTFHIFKNTYNNEVDYYSMVKGKIYKLNEGNIIFAYKGIGFFYWIEEDGTAKSINVRSEEYDEVYIEAEGVKWYKDEYDSFVTPDGKIVKRNSQKILAKVQEIS